MAPFHNSWQEYHVFDFILEVFAICFLVSTTFLYKKRKSCKKVSSICQAKADSFFFSEDIPKWSNECLKKVLWWETNSSKLRSVSLKFLSVYQAENIFKPYLQIYCHTLFFFFNKPKIIIWEFSSYIVF